MSVDVKAVFNIPSPAVPLAPKIAMCNGATGDSARCIDGASRMEKTIAPAI